MFAEQVRGRVLRLNTGWIWVSRWMAFISPELPTPDAARCWADMLGFITEEPCPES